MMGVTTLSLPSMIMLRKAVKPKLLGILREAFGEGNVKVVEKAIENHGKRD